MDGPFDSAIHQLVMDGPDSGPDVQKHRGANIGVHEGGAKGVDQQT
jgi:hypothetical protein